jgi:hypothetical protein
MRQYRLSDSAALRAIRPSTRKDWQSLAKLGAVVLFIGVCVAALLYNKHREEVQREQEWISATATIKEARTHLAIQSNSQGGGAMLYEVQILVSYPMNGVVREQWTTISQLPKLLADAQLQAHLLAEKQCIVRWPTNNPSQIVAEIN